MTALDLGGTLFLSATHKDMKNVVSGQKYSNLKSVLVDTEDALDDLESGLIALEDMLQEYTKNSLFVFIRPRNVEVLKQILSFKNIEKIDGFILPKFSLNNAKKYLYILANSSHTIMPSIEGSELFESAKLIELKNILLPYKQKIPLVRFGLEDMLRQLKMKRKCEGSIFDFAVTNFVLGGFIAVFKSAGFDISGGVYPCFKDKEGFSRDVKRDLKEGLISKTIIHPLQIDIFNEVYKVKKQEYNDALELSHPTNKQVFNQKGNMAEISTMLPYTNEILLRANVYGVE